MGGHREESGIFSNPTTRKKIYQGSTTTTEILVALNLEESRMNSRISSKKTSQTMEGRIEGMMMLKWRDDRCIT